MKTQQQTTKPITKRAYRMLANKTHRVEMRAQLADATSKLGLEAYYLRAKLVAYSVPCSGEAHSNAHIDHCMVCLGGDWGLVQNPALTK